MEDKILENENMVENIEPKDESLEQANETLDTIAEVTEESTEDVAVANEETVDEEVSEEVVVEDASEECPVTEETKEEPIKVEEEPKAEDKISVAPVEKAQAEKANKKDVHSFENTSEEVKEFSKKVNVERIIDKVSLVLLLLAIGIPVALLGYIIYTIVSFFI